MTRPIGVLWLFCCSVLLCMAGWSPAWAGDSTSDEWTFTVAPICGPSVWMVTWGWRGVKTSVNDSFIDIMQDSDSVMAFMGDFSASKDHGHSLSRRPGPKLGSDDESFGPIKADVTETITIIGFGTRYRLAEWSLADMPGRLTGVGEPNVHLRPARRWPLYAFKNRIGFQSVLVVEIKAKTGSIPSSGQSPRSG